MLQVLTDHTEEVWHIQFSRNGRWLASASKDATAIVWEVIPGQSLVKRHTLEGHSKPLTFCCWRPDSCMLATCSFDSLVKVWDVGTGECVCTIDSHQGATFTAAWHPDGKHLHELELCVSYSLCPIRQNPGAWKNLGSQQ